MKCLRVISKSQDITYDKAQAEGHANVSVLGTHGIQTAAKMAQKGDYTKARLWNLGNREMLSRAATTSSQEKEFKSFEKQGFAFEKEMAQVQKTEQAQGLFLDDEDTSEQPKEKKVFKSKYRKQARTDTTANMLYSQRNAKVRKGSSDEE